MAAERPAAHRPRTIAVALGAAMIFNAALVVVACCAFHAHGHADVADLRDAHRLLAPALGSELAPCIFALALLASGLSSTLSGTLAGQVVMTGMIDVRLPAWQQRLLTRACAIVPAVLVVALRGEASVTPLLIASQVVLSLALPLSLVPLALLASSPARMGALASGPRLRAATWAGVAIVVVANAMLVSGALHAE
jgi:manganese transport protein